MDEVKVSNTPNYESLRFANAIDDLSLSWAPKIERIDDEIPFESGGSYEIEHEGQRIAYAFATDIGTLIIAPDDQSEYEPSLRVYVNDTLRVLIDGYIREGDRVFDEDIPSLIGQSVYSGMINDFDDDPESKILKDGLPKNALQIRVQILRQALMTL